MAFPSTISTFNIVNPTDRLNNPSHSALHNSISSVLTQVQTIIGVEGDNSVVGSLEYLIKSPDSNGGGHIQTANKGGTGQITYTKGDLLVATSSSVLAKQATSSTAGEVLVIDPNQPTNMKWAAVVANKITVSNSVVSIDRWQGSVTNVIFATSILGSTLGTNNAIRFTGVLPVINTQNEQITFQVKYGNNVITDMTFNSTGTRNMNGDIQGVIISNNAVSSQISYLKLNTYAGGSSIPSLLGAFAVGTSSINSSANNDLIITARYSGTQSNNSILTSLFVVEKIV